MLKDSPAGYGSFSIALHWISALLVVLLFALGVWMVDLDYYHPWYHRAPSLHVSFGLLLLLLTLIRLLWRCLNPRPAPLDSYSASVRFLSGLVKLLLYLCMIGLIVSGYLVTSADGRPPSFFGLLNFPVWIQLGPTGVDGAGEIHEILAWCLIALALVHGAAALRHHFVLRDRTLLRMLKPAKKSPQ